MKFCKLDIFDKNSQFNDWIIMFSMPSLTPSVNRGRPFSSLCVLWNSFLSFLNYIFIILFANSQNLQWHADMWYGCCGKNNECHPCSSFSWPWFILDWSKVNFPPFNKHVSEITFIHLLMLLFFQNIMSLIYFQWL